MKKLLILLIAVLISTPLYAWMTDEEAKPTPHEEYENPSAEFTTQKIVGLLIQDIQVKFMVNSTRGKDFLRDLHGDTETSLPKGMYTIVGDGKSPITKYEAEDALEMITDYYVWDSMNESEQKIKYMKTIYDVKRVTKKEKKDFKKEVDRHVNYYTWFNYYYQKLSAEEIMPEEVLSQEEFFKKVKSGDIELDED